VNSTIFAVDDTRRGNNFVDFLFGVKVSLAKGLFLLGGATVPLNDEGLRPDALGTIGLEWYF
jgi:hypothetical protein